GNHRNRQGAGACRLSVDMDGACAAQRHAATELGSGQAERIAQDPKERHLRNHINALSFPVQCELYGHETLLKKFSLIPQARPANLNGSSRTRLPVALKTALVIAGTTCGLLCSPSPVGL